MPKNVLILGSGIIGLCCAHYLVGRGHRVTIVDRDGAQAQGCSFGNAGMIVPSHFVPLAAPGMVGMALRMMLNPRSPFSIQPRLDAGLFSWMWHFHRSATAPHVKRAAPVLRDLNLASRKCYEELSDTCGNDFGLVKNGLLMLCNTNRGLHEESDAAETANRLGIPARVLDARQTAELEPDVKMDIAGSVHFPLDCHLSPDRLMQSLRQRLADAGANFIWNADVKELRREARKIVAAVTKAGTEIAADEFVLCAGSWSGELARDLGLKLLMQAGKGYSLTLANPPLLPRLCAILTEARVAMTPMDGRVRFGGTMEMSGLNQRIYRKRVEGIIRSACAYYPQFSEADFAAVEPWCGLRPCSPDGLPYLGRTRKFSNLCIATGHAMMGMSLGPITGKIVAQIIDEGRTEMDVSLLDPDRYER
ncbi:MAG TPA: FAD-dependent oxidoreductase [Tepidisphaeraceae bacterium]|jgi:D-amino-acid dehydrogenase|nr:FAD-dependent oxidoreductase [Tepidisphaeraceae bacterium]